MIELPTINAVTVVFNENAAALKATVPVVRYMQSVARFGKITLFTAAPAPTLPGIEVIQIWPTEPYGYSLWITRLLRYFVRHPYMLFFQDDGFILQPELWEIAFLDYDFIGAPWEDGVVGNGGFCIQSQRFMWAQSQIEWDGVDGPDWFYCRTKRPEMEALGVRYAPTEVAARFSSELTGHDHPTFGYHGWQYSPAKHELGQKLIAPYVHA